MLRSQQNGVNSLKEILKPYGIYNAEEKCLYLNDNKHLQNHYIMNQLKELKIKIQLDLFT